MRKLGMEDRSGGANAERTRLKNQMRRLFGCTVTLVYEDEERESRVSSLIADRADYWWNTKRPAAPVLWDSTIELGEKFFQEIIAHPVPLDLNILRSLKRSPLGLDLYFWLTYRTFALKSPLQLSWRQLYRQFGAEPNRASKVAQQAFRRDCLRELKKIKRAWPDLHYETVRGGLLLSPSPPLIPPAQLPLVSGWASLVVRRAVAARAAQRGRWFPTNPCDFRSFPSVKHVTSSAPIYRLNTSLLRADLSVKHVTHVHIVLNK